MKIKKYDNGSYSYYSERLERQHNIPSELGAYIIALQTEVKELKDTKNK